MGRRLAGIGSGGSFADEGLISLNFPGPPQPFMRALLALTVPNERPHSQSTPPTLARADLGALVWGASKLHIRRAGID